MKALERHFGVRLFERTATGVRLTEAGAIVLDAADAILNAADRMERLVAEIRGARRGRVVIAANTTGGMYVVPPIIAAFAEQQPEVDLQLQIEATELIYERLDQSIVDVAVVGGPTDPERFAVRRLCPDQLVLISHPRHPLAQRSALGLHDVARSELVLPEHGSRMRALVEQAFREARIAVRPRLVVSGTEAIKRAVASRLGVGFVSAYAVVEEVRGGVLRVLSVTDGPPPRDYEIITRKDRYVSPALQSFVDFALEQGAGMRPPVKPAASHKRAK